MKEIKIQLKEKPSKLPQDESTLGFGKIFSDHMFVMDYNEEKKWHDPMIIPYGPMEFYPSTTCFHYGQTTFEGLKAYRTSNDEILLFRPELNFKRLNISNERLCIPKLDEEFCLEALKKLLKIDKDFVPHTAGSSLYIRPFVIAIDPALGANAGKLYRFFIICSPSGSYYASGLNPVKIYVEDNYVRAVKGGMGMAKTGGNYAVSLKSQVNAHDIDYSQVLWLDGVERKYIEEVGAMNIFFVIDDEVITPELSGSILDGITRRSMIELLQKEGKKVSQRRISIDEIVKAYDDNRLKEVFGTGTAAVISPVGELKFKDKVMKINNNKIGPISQHLYDTLTGIQWGRIEDKYNWTTKVI
jgi:branched-chain-amino-acid transaminase